MLKSDWVNGVLTFTNNGKTHEEIENEFYYKIKKEAKKLNEKDKKQ